MNRQQRRAQAKIQHSLLVDMGLSDRLTEVPRSEFPLSQNVPDKAWRSNKYLVQLYTVKSAYFPGLVRLSINRVKMGAKGRWHEDLTWDELHAIKQELGYGSWYGLEVYPCDKDVVNVASMRHLWLMPEPLPIGWFK